jgi:hypothetical protein
MAITVNHQTNDISATSGSVTIDGAAIGGADILLLSTTTISSSVSSVDISLTGSHDIYMVEISDLKSSLTSSSTGILRMRVSDDGGATFESTNTQYITAGRQVYSGDNSGTGAGGAGFFRTTESGFEGSYIPLSYIGAVSPSTSPFEVYSGRFFIYAAKNTSTKFNVVGDIGSNGSDVVANVRFTGMFQENQEITTIRVYPESGTLDSGKIRLFSVGG